MAQTHEQLIGRLAGVLASLRDIASLSDRLCEAGRRMLLAEGAVITLATSEGDRVALCSTDELSLNLVDLQDVVGQGPLIDAFESASVQIAEFDGQDEGRWAMMHEHGSRLGFRGTLIAVPLRIDEHTIGVLSAHRHGSQDEDDQTIGTFLGVALGTALMQDPELGLDAYAQHEGWPSRAQIHQATGMVVAQVGILPQDALALLKGQAFARGISLVDVAEQIVDRRINFRHFTIEGD